MGRSMKAKTKMPPNTRRSRRFQSSVTEILTAVVFFAHCSRIASTFPIARALLVTTSISLRDNSRNNCIGTTKRLFVWRDFLGNEEQSLLPQEHQESAELECSEKSRNSNMKRKSRISSIRCENFAGMTNGQHHESSKDENVISFSFDDNIKMTSSIDSVSNDDTDFGGNLICVTGETGSGKSLLVAKIADLLTGGKASVSMLHGARDITSARNTNNQSDDENLKSCAASVEMVLSLHDNAHISYLLKALRLMGVDPNIVLQQSDDDESKTQMRIASLTLVLKRVISSTPMSTNHIKNERSDKGKPTPQRLKSSCFINGHSVTLKTLKTIASPLIAVMNAPLAAIALGRPTLRLSMIDSGIPPSILSQVDRLQKEYRKCKQYRESLENDLEKQVLPVSMIRRGIRNCEGDDALPSTTENEEQLELLRHWIDELDSFERRISELKDNLGSVSEFSISLADEDLGNLLSGLNTLDWTSDAHHDDEKYKSSLYETLLDLHDYLKLLDARILAATEARESLSSLSVSDSVRMALDRTRRLLIDATAPMQQKGSDNTNLSKASTGACVCGSVNSRVGVATEQAHEMLNLVEDALSECADYLEDDKGLIATLQTSRRSCSVSTESLLEYITDWNMLARKHGVSPYQLTLCHTGLKRELEGGIEAGKLLPEAKIAEKKAFNELKEACLVLTKARSKVCHRVSASISRRLPRLGMENSKFEARLRLIDSPLYSKSHLGADEVDFYLFHRHPENSAPDNERSSSQDQQIGGKIESVASSGEKARVLLAIECEIPGSISATSSESLIGSEEAQLLRIPPVAVIYDEIDAHVGGRASVSVAQMLYDQSRAYQVLSITHSPSLAAIADKHICVSRGKATTNGRMFDVIANRVEGVERRKELARMASGDVVMNEAEVFAEALLRDASSIKIRAPKLQP